jgi:hypothetical protein
MVVHADARWKVVRINTLFAKMGEYLQGVEQPTTGNSGATSTERFVPQPAGQ